MSDSRVLRLVVKGGSDIVDAALSRADGGGPLDRGVRELVAEAYPGVTVEVRHEPSAGFAELRQELEAGTSTLIGDRPDVLLISAAPEVAGLGAGGSTPEQAVGAVRGDLVAAVELIKEKVGAHVLVANVSTIDPDDTPFTYHDLDQEPFGLRAHRIDYLLVGVSHDEGVSIIDVDRLVAELGAGGNVHGPAVYGAVACERIAAEIVRVLDDYGFFDDRPLLAQVGARHAGG